jgi:hypothetical protein
MSVTIGAATIAGALGTPSTVAAAGPNRALATATLVTWLFDAVSGGYMLRTWIVRGGLHRQRARDRLAPRVVFAHFGLASTGLLVWLGYLDSRWIVLAWLAVGLLMLVIGLGVSTVTVWTPFPAHWAATPGTGAGPGSAGPGSAEPGGSMAGGPAENALTGAVTDDVLRRALTDEVLLGRLVDDVVSQANAARSLARKRQRAHLATLIPAGHGVAAVTTMVLAVLTAASAR